MSSDWKRMFTKYDIIQTVTEAEYSCQNRSETGICELKKSASLLITKKNAPLRLWCFAMEYAEDIRCLTATKLFMERATHHMKC